MGPQVYIVKPGYACFPAGQAFVRKGSGFQPWEQWPLPEWRELRIALPPGSGLDCSGPMDCPVGRCDGSYVPYDKMRVFKKVEHQHAIASGLRGRDAYDVEPDLFLAVAGNDALQITRLVARGANPNARNSFGYSPLMLAAERDFPEVATRLIALGAPVDGQNKAVDTPLLIALQWKHFQTAQVLLDHQAAINQASGYGVTPLMEAARSGNADLVALLLARGAQVDAATTNGALPVHFGCLHTQILQMLIVKGAAVNAVDREGKTVFEYTLEWSRDPKLPKEVLSFLLDQGFDVKGRDHGGRTLLGKALFLGAWDSASLLIERGTEVDTMTKEGVTPLMIVAARSNGPADIAEQLLAHGAAIDRVDSSRDTSLHLAIRSKNLEVARVLIRRGADLSRKNWAGEAPLGVARRNHLDDIAALLLSQGAQE